MSADLDAKLYAAGCRFRCHRCGTVLPAPPWLHSNAFVDVVATVTVCSEECQVAQEAQWRADRKRWKDEAVAAGWTVLE